MMSNEDLNKQIKQLHETISEIVNAINIIDVRDFKEMNTSMIRTNRLINLGRENDPPRKD